MTEQARPTRIVVGVDGSRPSSAALRWAVDQAERVDGVVEAVLAWEYPIGWRGWIPPADEASFEQDAGRLLADAVWQAVGAARPARIRTRVGRGNPAQVLLDAARGAQLLVVGHRGRGGFADALLGSVSHHCVEHAPCPVVVVRGTQQ